MVKVEAKGRIFKAGRSYMLYLLCIKANVLLIF